MSDPCDNGHSSHKEAMTSLQNNWMNSCDLSSYIRSHADLLNVSKMWTSKVSHNSHNIMLCFLLSLGNQVITKSDPWSWSRDLYHSMSVWDRILLHAGKIWVKGVSNLRIPWNLLYIVILYNSYTPYRFHRESKCEPMLNFCDTLFLVSVQILFVLNHFVSCLQ